MLSLEEAKYLGKISCVLKLGKSFCKCHQENIIVTYDVSPSEGNIFCYCGFAQKLKSQYNGMLKEDKDDGSVPYFASCFIDRNLEIITFVEWCVPSLDEEEKRLPLSADIVYIKRAEERVCC